MLGESQSVKGEDATHGFACRFSVNLAVARGGITGVVGEGLEIKRECRTAAGLKACGHVRCHKIKRVQITLPRVTGEARKYKIGHAVRPTLGQWLKMV